MGTCFRGFYQWVTRGKKDMQSVEQAAQSLDLAAIIQLFKAVQTSGRVSAKKLHCMESRQAKSHLKATDALRLTDMYAQGESWSNSAECLNEIIRQLRLGIHSYGQMTADCDMRRGQFQVWDRTRASMQGPLYKLTWKLPDGSSHM